MNTKHKRNFSNKKLYNWSKNQEQQTIYFSQKANDMEKRFENQKFETQSAVNKLQIVTNEMQFQVEYGIQLTAEIARLNEQVRILKESLHSWSSVGNNKHTQMGVQFTQWFYPETTKQQSMIDLLLPTKLMQQQNNTKQSPKAALRSRINSTDGKVFKVIHNLYNKAKSYVKIMKEMLIYLTAVLE